MKKKKQIKIGGLSSLPVKKAMLLIFNERIISKTKVNPLNYEELSAYIEGIGDAFLELTNANPKEFKLDKNSACVSKKQGNVSGSLVGAVDCVRKDYCTSFPDRCKECEDAPMMDYFKPKRKKLFGGM